MDHWEAPREAGEWELGLYSAGGDNGRRGLQGYRDLPYKEAEYGCSVYCDATDSILLLTV